MTYTTAQSTVTLVFDDGDRVASFDNAADALAYAAMMNGSTPDPDPDPEPPAPTPKPRYPAEVLDMRQWKLTRPASTEVLPGPLQKFQQDRVFEVVEISPGRFGVLFRANCGGSTTPNSTYPRSELREYINGKPAAWSNKTGSHEMTLWQTITHLPVKKPHVVAGQIHDANDDVTMIRLEGKHLFVESRGVDVGLLDANYVLGTRFKVKVVANAGGIIVAYNDTATPVRVPVIASGCYFKAGCYTQSNVSKGDAATAYGEVIIDTLLVKHVA